MVSTRCSPTSSPINRHFYKYTPLRPLEEIEADLKAIEKEIFGMMSDEWKEGDRLDADEIIGGG